MKDLKNLYKIIFTHYAQKGSKTGIETYIIAKDNNEVFDIMATAEKWKSPDDIEIDFDEASSPWSSWEEEYQEYKEDIIENQGLIDSHYIAYDDLYYGLTVYGWELVKEDVSDELIQTLKDLKIINNLY